MDQPLLKAIAIDLKQRQIPSSTRSSPIFSTDKQTTNYSMFSVLLLFSVNQRGGCSREIAVGGRADVQDESPWGKLVYQSE